jgi:hypothetical protein
VAKDVKFIIKAQDSASSVLDKVAASGKKAASDINGAFGGLRGVFSSLTGVVGTLAAVAGGMAFQNIVETTVNWALESNKLAQALGSTVEQASIYKVAMETLGIDQETMEKAALRLGKTLGTNEDAFKRLGIATRDSTGHLRATTEIMPEVNRALADMKAGTDRNIAAQEIYGKSWSEIRELLKLTPAAMDEAKEAAERLHLVVGAEGVQQAREYKKNMNELGLVAKSLEVQFGNVLLPMLVKFGSYIGENAPVLVSAFSYSLQFVVKVAQTVGEYVGLVAYRIYSLGAIAKDIVTGNWAEAKADWRNMANAEIDYLKKQKERWSTWDDSSKKPKSTEPAGNRLEPDTTAEAEAEEKKYLDNIKNTIAGVKECTSAVRDLGKERLQAANEIFSEKLKDEIDLYKEGARAAGDLIKPLRRYNVEANNIFNQRLADEKSALGKLGSLYEEFKKKVSLTAQTKEARVAGVDILKAYKDTALGIISVEQERYKTLLAGERQYANIVRGLIMEKRQEIKDLQKSIDDANKVFDENRRSALQGSHVSGQFRYLDNSLDPYEKRAALIDELRRKELEYNAISDPAERKTKLMSLVAEWEKLGEAVEITTKKTKTHADFQGFSLDGFIPEITEVTESTQTLITKEESLAQVARERERIQKEVMSGAQGELQALEAAHQSSLEKMEGYKAKLQELDGVLKNMTQTITIDLKVNGMEQIQAIQNLLAGAGGAVADSSQARLPFDGPKASGGPVRPNSLYVVGERGPEILRMGSQGGTIIPNNQLGGSSITIGSVSVVVQGGDTGQATAREIARKLWPEFKKLAANERSG